MDIDLKGKTSKEIVELLNQKYPTRPRYINPKKIDNNIGGEYNAIDTATWEFVRPEYVHGKYTGKWWIPVGSGLLNDDWVIKKLLLNTNELENATLPTNELEKATLPTNGGRRRAQRKTKVKSKKRANKRRTRSRK